MADAQGTRIYDKRVVQRYLRRGELDDREWERHLRSLPDLAEQAVPVESEFEDTLED